MAPTKLVNIVPLVRPASPYRPSAHEWEPCSEVRLAPQPRKPTIEEEFEKSRRMSEASVFSQVRSSSLHAAQQRWVNRDINQPRTPLIGSHASNSYYGGGYYTPQLQTHFNFTRVHQKPAEPVFFEQDRELYELLSREFPQGPPPGMERLDAPSWPSLAELEAFLPNMMDFPMDQDMTSSPISENVDLEDTSLFDSGEFLSLSGLSQDWQQLQDELMPQRQSSS